MYARIGKFTATPGNQQALADRLVGGTTSIRVATGLRQYLIYTGPEDGVWVTEVWDTKADHDASLELPGMREFIAETMPMIAGMDGSAVELVGGIGLAT